MQISPTCKDEAFGAQPVCVPILLALRRAASLSTCALILFAFILLAPLNALAQKPTQFDVEAAYLFNFAKYVRWPPHDPGNFEICVLGSDPFGNSLDQITHGEKINGEQLTLRHLQVASDALTCRIVFLGSTESKHLAQDLTLLSGRPILTVSDIANFASNGGEIQFVNDDGRVRFLINRRAAEKCGLALSSELLKVAKLVLADAPAGRE